MDLGYFEKRRFEKMTTSDLKTAHGVFAERVAEHKLTFGQKAMNWFNAFAMGDVAFAATLGGFLRFSADKIKRMDAQREGFIRNAASPEEGIWNFVKSDCQGAKDLRTGAVILASVWLCTLVGSGILLNKDSHRKNIKRLDFVDAELDRRKAKAEQTKESHSFSP